MQQLSLLLFFLFLFCFHILFHCYPNLIWFLFSSLFQDIIKGNTFTNYNTTFNFSMTHILKLVKPQFFLFSSGWEKSLLSHMQQWDLKSISEKKKKNGRELVLTFHFKYQLLNVYTVLAIIHNQILCFEKSANPQS